MNVSREQIAQALLTLLQGVNANISYSPAYFPAGCITRAPAIFSNTPPANQPAMFIFHPGEEASQNENYGATKWQMVFMLLIYAKADPSRSELPDTVVNAILDGIERTLTPKPPYERQTLGGIVTNCYLHGMSNIDSAVISPQIAIWQSLLVETGA